MKYLLALSIMAAMACNSGGETAVEEQAATSTDNSKGFDWQGHRGCRGIRPENTVPAMLHALSLGVTTLEMDVVITKDSVCILSHEPFFSHEITTLPDGTVLTEEKERDYNIYQMRFEETQQYDVGLKPHPRFPDQSRFAATKPSLEQVFNAVKAWCDNAGKPLPFFNIETKTTPAGDGIFHPAPEAFVDILMTVVNSNNMQDKVIIQSFDFRTLQYLHEKYPLMPTAALVEDFDLLPYADQLNKLGFTPAIYSPAWQLVNDSLVEYMHSRQVKVIPWTVNDSAVAQQMKAIGVDGIITDYPDRIR